MPVILNELGTVTPTATVTVMPNQAVSGYLVEVPFQEGQDVQKDQVLAQIDPRPFQAALDQAIGTLQRDQGPPRRSEDGPHALPEARPS